MAVCPLALTGIVLWIRSLVTRYYKNKNQERAKEYVQQEIADKDERISRLEAEVASLAHQLHRDNHLLSALDRYVQMLENSGSKEEEAQIIREIHTLYAERNDLIGKELQENKILPTTSIALIDASIKDMYIKAASKGINFDLIVGEEPHYLVNHIISQTDLQTLLCDHIKDAIIAIESGENIKGNILVSIVKNDGVFEVSVKDNGVDFTPQTLAQLGLKRVTTHADTGGSGIGFETTFSTLKKTKASLILTEYEQKEPFSKSITFSFDGLNQFVIQSYRKELLQRSLHRDDIIYV